MTATGGFVATGLTARPKLAVTVAAELTVQVLVPVQEPLQPLKRLRTPLLVAVSTTELPTTKLALHVAPDAQLIPAGALVTPPEPLTVTVTLKLVMGVAVSTGELRRGAVWPPIADPSRKPSAASATSGTNTSTRRSTLTFRIPLPPR
jgi:hypothetical protein